MNKYKIIFEIIETIAFIAPALPSNLNHRLTICGSYLLAHLLGLQTAYKKIKLSLIKVEE